MRIGRSAVALAALVGTVTLVAGAAHADPIKCRRAITKANTGYFSALEKLIEKCKIGAISKGAPVSLATCSPTGIDNVFAPGKVTAASDKANATIAGACCGADKICGNGDDDTLASIGWAIGSCMNFENGSCNNAITSPGDIGTCITCIDKAATEEADDTLIVDNFNNANFFPNGGVEPQKSRQKCQVTILKNAGKFIQAKTKTMNKCWDAKANDPGGAKGFGDATQCPDTDPAGKTATAILSAEQKKVAGICKACGGGGDADKNGVCDAVPADPLSTIVNPFSCPSVTQPPSALNGNVPVNCGAITVSNLQTYIQCIDCVLEYKVDCMTDAGQGDFNGTPGDGNGGTQGIDYAQQCNPPPPNFCTGGSPNGMLDAGEACDPSAPPPGNTCLQGAAACSSLCTCACPNLVTFRGDPAVSELDTGWTGIAHDSKVVSNGDITVDLNCSASQRPCGTCPFTGPVENPAAGAGDLRSRRCATQPWIPCTTNAQCTGSGNSCIFYFGAPLPLSSGGVATCVINKVVGAVTGTANVESGESASTLNLTSQVFTGILTSQPCPTCTDPGAINDGASGGGTCNGGDRNGQACDANSQSPVPAFGRTSLDCPPSAGAEIAKLPIGLHNSTDPESRSLSAASPTCTANMFGGDKCACDTCNDAAATPCASNADCTTPGHTICGGLRCLNDSTTPGTLCSSQGTGTDPVCGTGTCNTGTNVCATGPSAGDPNRICFVDQDCGGTCDRPGEPTKPNTCSNGVCNSGGGADDGICATGPNDNLCSVETFRSCTTNANCRPPGEGGSCADCAPGLQTCGLKRRECLFDLDNSPTPGVGTITVNGMEDTPVSDVSHPTLASLFCIGPTGSSAVNGVAGLPGLGKLKLTGTAKGLP